MRRPVPGTGPMLLRGAAVLAAALWLSGCAIGPMLNAADYEGEPQTVEIACEDPFRVLENAKRRRLKVSSAFLPELGRSFRTCENPDIARLQRSERFQLAARNYLKRTDRAACSIASTTVLALNSYEFHYSCSEDRGSKGPHAGSGPKKKGRS